jgi:hypothetical protein
VLLAHPCTLLVPSIASGNMSACCDHLHTALRLAFSGNRIISDHEHATRACVTTAHGDRLATGCDLLEAKYTHGSTLEVARSDAGHLYGHLDQKQSLRRSDEECVSLVHSRAQAWSVFVKHTNVEDQTCYHHP